MHVSVGGSWSMETPWPAEADDALAGLADQRIHGLTLTDDGLRTWDTSLLVFLTHLVTAARTRDLPVQQQLPEGLTRLMQLAFAVPAKEGAARKNADAGLLADVGGAVLNIPPKIADFFSFVGEIALSLWNFFLGRSQMRLQDLIAAMHESGIAALPIISLTSMLFGLILAFVGAVQLTQFGAQIYVAGLVGIGMLRVMGAVMVGVVMSGRVGAAYAALIGTMQVNEEVDALATLGISPVDFLVLPRVLALTVMVPILTLYADITGILGGFLVGTLMLGLNPLEYYNATVQLVAFTHVLIGLTYGTVFGVIIAVAGCYQGMRCGRSAQAVGQATTTAVVHSIVGIITATAIITVLCNVLGV